MDGRLRIGYFGRSKTRTAGAVIVGVVAYSISVVIVFATGQEYFAIPIIFVALALMSCGVAAWAAYLVSH